MIDIFYTAWGKGEPGEEPRKRAEDFFGVTKDKLECIENDLRTGRTAWRLTSTEKRG